MAGNNLSVMCVICNDCHEASSVINQIKSTKSNQPNQINQIKSTKSNQPKQHTRCLLAPPCHPSKQQQSHQQQHMSFPHHYHHHSPLILPISLFTNPMSTNLVSQLGGLSAINPCYKHLVSSAQPLRLELKSAKQ